VEFLGRKEVSEIIEKIFLVSYTPLLEIYEHTNLPDLVGVLATAAKSIIGVADKCEGEVNSTKKSARRSQGKEFQEDREIFLDEKVKEDYLKQYKERIQLLLEKLYIHLRAIVLNDETKTLQKLATFFTSRFQSMQFLRGTKDYDDSELMDLDALLSNNLTPDQISVLLEQELPYITNYEKAKKKKKLGRMVREDTDIFEEEKKLDEERFPVLETLAPIFMEKCHILLKEAREQLQVGSVSSKK